MQNFNRFLMRVLLVPLGYIATSVAVMLVLLNTLWHRVGGGPFLTPDMPLLELLLVLLLLHAPALIGILISEVFAIRSWVFHVFNGVVSVWLGWEYVGAAIFKPVPLNQPLVIAAGIVGGLAYWAVAGFSAGFYKPIFRRDPPPVVPATTR